MMQPAKTANATSITTSPESVKFLGSPWRFAVMFERRNLYQIANKERLYTQVRQSELFCTVLIVS
jgi:hypothetical protein